MWVHVVVVRAVADEVGAGAAAVVELEKREIGPEAVLVVAATPPPALPLVVTVAAPSTTTAVSAGERLFVELLMELKLAHGLTQAPLVCTT